MRARGGALLLVIVLAGCGLRVPTAQLVPRAQALSGGTFTEALVGRVGSLNPLFEAEENDRDIDGVVYQGLTRVGDGGDSERVVPLLARDWTVSPDMLSYTFNLRTDVRWADGVPFTAGDVMFTYSVLQSPAYDQATKQIWKDVTVEQLGSSSVRFTLKAPSASFPLALRQGIIPRHLFARLPVSAIAQDLHSGDRALGTGPYRVTDISADRTRVQLVANPYANPRPYLERLAFHTYPSLQGAVDAVLSGQAGAVGAPELPKVDEIVKRPDLDVYQPSTFSVVTVLFNLSQGASVYFDQDARRALAMAVDRQAIVDGVLGPNGGEPAFGPIPPDDWAYSAAETAGKLAYNPKAAARLLESDGWALDAQTGLRSRDGRQFSVSLVTPDGYPYQQIADLVSSQLRQVGVQVRVQPVPASELISKHLLPRDYQMALFAYDSGPDPDQYGFWHSGAPAGSLNFMGPLVARPDLIDKDLEDGRAGADREHRRPAYADFQTLMTAAAPAIFVLEPRYTYLVSRRQSRVQGVTMNAAIEPVDRLEYIAGWYINSKPA